MHILIDQHGANVDCLNHRFKIWKGEKERKINPRHVSAMHFLRNANISTPALKLAAQYDIPVLIYDAAGKVQCRIWSPHFGSHAAIRIQQLRFSTDIEGLLWVKTLLTDKINGQIGLLKFLADRKPGQATSINAYIQKITPLKHSLALFQVVQDKNYLRLIEARCARYYWAAMAVVLLSKGGFYGREKRPARDRVNCLLNYLYGILYGIVEGALLAAGLDPHLGILHRMEYNRPSFVYDCIEPFRPWADKLVVQWVLNRQLQPEWFDDTSEGIRLNTTGKKNVIPVYFAWMDEKVLFNGKRIKRKDQVQYLATKLAQTLLNQNQDKV